MRLIKDGPFAGLKRNHYKAILADPPWKFEAGGKGRKAPYMTMPIDEIVALPVDELAAKDCALFLWTSGPFLQYALDCVIRWGFVYKTYSFVWVKTWPREEGRLFVDWQEVFDGGADENAAAGTGHWTMANAEIVVLATRGKPERVSTGVRQIIAEPRREHSRKPEAAADRIEKLVQGPYLELFARRSRPGWRTWGNQSTKFDAQTLQLAGE